MISIFSTLIFCSKSSNIIPHERSLSPFLKILSAITGFEINDSENDHEATVVLLAEDWC